VTINTNGQGLEYKVNGTTYSSPKLFNWDIGSTQTLTAVSPQVMGAIKYVFSKWSNNNDTNLTQVITVNSNTALYTALYKTQFRLMSFEDPSGLPIVITNSYNFFDSATVVNVSVSPTQVQFNGMTYYFNHWFGTGQGSYSGTSANMQVTMHAPINEMVFYDTINTSISQIGSIIPDKYVLYQNYPNPFNPETKIKFDIAKSGLTKLKVYDLLGKEIQTIYTGNLNAGRYEFNFNGREYASGIYIYKLETDNYTQIMKMVLIK
jgi:hypothetical protein